MKPAEEQQILSVLEAIGEDASRSQRQVSGLTGLNLAKVNFVIRRLVERGLVSLRNVSENPNRLRYLYELTPAGALERSRLMYRFLLRTIEEYDAVEARVRGRLEALRASGVRRIALLGADSVSSAVVGIVRHVEGLHLAAVYDGEAPHRSVSGVRVLAASEARNGDFDRIIAFPREPGDSPATIAARLGLDPQRVVVL
jgi:DNA-binding MarR family transcriptional regulator